jgi:hypothetical protein
MAIRKQMYEWDLYGNGAFSPSDYPDAGVEYSIFTGGYGNLVNEVNLVAEDEFLVLEKIACSPGVSPEGATVDAGNLTKWIPNMQIQVVIDTTGYYRDPQNIYSSGVSGMASAYPSNLAEIPYYALTPPIYIRPFQTWDIRYTMYNDLKAAFSDGFFTDIPSITAVGRVWVSYTLFDGTDAMIANKLLSIGIPITVDSVQWFRKLLIQSRGLDTESFDFYLKAAKEYRDREDKKATVTGLKPYSPKE